MNETNQSVGEASLDPAGSGAAPDAVAAAEAKAQDNWNQFMRARAEFENYRKRTEREIDQARKFAVERFAAELLPVSDALEAGIRAGVENPGPALIEGAQATLRELNRAFDKAGIKVIDPQGQPFDPNWHEAMLAQESREAAANTVLSVVQKGYALNGRLLRPARVVVSKAPADSN